ncbi:hypothetical protein [Methylosinus sp. PW1]|uniref:hypothetical protein n=1 Tax=Methylosinus sp. PW1 TaxID=107636 RepID=UPI00068AA083|nr:hypothetical protein [Methylosinus sp. PW1]
MTDQAIILTDDLPEIVLETGCVSGGTTLVLSDDLPWIGIGTQDPEPQMLMLEQFFVGPPGADGPQGLPGRDATTFTWDQASASNIWAIAHNLGRFPGVTTVDPFGAVFEGTVSYVDANNVRVEFNAAVNGKAYLN